ncbi:hypothetical protein Amir_0087 [Actinosynnema mirum DSM 43827]|uniref:Uncharacterized protein n=1 Tax=Actinosynnema mirum (strain ATCC 29888 / DSM 43827 / JCM 3225 / NBRC 14064 / NCIMB 13271 / NRRL B-12336 / IMRU 3971 / 101) TaxID=446462 RepID=C6WDR6_ACTMD|nr:hypothetical protein Amir_0087 [Actinosynnema mirum DSM 43827]AXX27453.1 hypothetical protein APASM_0088 [Actinosynnema pretiosum subsp. pretiosum]
MVVPNQPSTEGAAIDDRWTHHCLETASRRVFGWVVLGALAFTAQLVLVLWSDVPSHVPFALLAFSLGSIAWGLVRRPSPAGAMREEPWRFARVHWSNGRLVVHGEEKSSVLEVRGAGPLVRGRIGKHRRAWLVLPDRQGNTVVTFRGVPKLFPARVLRAPVRRGTGKAAGSSGAAGAGSAKGVKAGRTRRGTTRRGAKERGTGRDRSQG